MMGKLIYFAFFYSAMSERDAISSEAKDRRRVLALLVGVGASGEEVEGVVGVLTHEAMA